MTTRSREIPRKEWKHFLDEISRHYLGRSVDLECAQEGQTMHALARHLPFIGCTLEEENPAHIAIEVAAGDVNGQLVTHIVPSPRRVWMKQEANGCDNEMAIESSDGSTLLVEFAGLH